MNKKPDPKFLDTLSGVEPTETDKSDSKDFENRLAKLKAEDEHGRDRITLEVVAWCLRGLIVLVFAIIWVAVFALGWHTLLPEKCSWMPSGNCHWLSPEQFGNLKSFMLSGAIVSLGAGYLRRYI